MRRVALFPQGPLLVGRGTHNHLVLNDYRISRQHARVAPERDGFVVYDLNSANGTFVNNVAVRRQVLKPNDEVSFGPLRFRLEVQVDDVGVPGHHHPPNRWRATESVTKFNRVIPPAKTAHPNNIRDTIPPETSDSPDSPATPETDVFPAASAIHSAATIAPPPPPPRSSPSVDPDIPSAPRSVDSMSFQAAGAVVDLNQLEDAYEKLGTVYAFMHAISKTIDKSQLLALIANKILEIYPQARTVGIYLRRGPEAETPFHLSHHVGGNTRGSVPDDENVGFTALPVMIARSILRDQTALFGTEAQSAMRGGLTMYSPIIEQDTVLGIIRVEGEPRHGGFSVADLELLKGVSAPAAIMLQNARMHEESLNRERLRRDLELAAQIQKSFLPQGIYAPGFELFATYKAAYAVGGDFYDAFWVGPDQLAVFIGDISGKGVAAALLMARISGELRVAALAHIDPVAVFSIMNRALIGRDQPELFFTAIYFTLDVKTGVITLANAGHPPPYVLHADGSKTDVITEGASVAVGMLEDPLFTSTEIQLQRGDSLILYTDGVIEAADVRGDLFGDVRLRKALAQVASSRPKDISDRVLQSVEQYTYNAPVSDDLTLFICHRETEVDKPAALASPLAHASAPDAR